MLVLRNYWANTAWPERLRTLIIVGFLSWVLCLPLLRPLIPAWLAGLWLPRLLAGRLLSSPTFGNRLTAVLCVSVLLDGLALDYAQRAPDWVLWLMLAWIWFGLGCLAGIHFWTRALFSPAPAAEEEQPIA